MAAGGGEPRTGTRRIDTSRPHSARMYDYYLGGKTHYEVDAQAAEAVIAAMPVARRAARANRDFMIRATRWLTAEAGVRQFLDIGSGIPTEPNLHQVAQAVAPECRVVYSDNDPIVLQYAQALLHSTPEGRTAYVQGDVLEPSTVLGAAELRGTLDLDEPVALTVNALFHFVSDARDPYGIVRELLGVLPRGSYLVLSHATSDFTGQEQEKDAENVKETYAKGGSPLSPRNRAEVERFFEGLEMVEPGVVPPQRWRPEAGLPDSASIPYYAGVARKP
ncbi:SAM-dependent methyltransferase [Streptomyces sp. ODS28]|uniref:SAM-dependent methyltransferase n=1 Tax=Streptomyces sp. ODS28 TaxID=3136688 RepID=UPI0031F11221